MSSPARATHAVCTGSSARPTPSPWPPTSSTMTESAQTLEAPLPATLPVVAEEAASQDLGKRLGRATSVMVVLTLLASITNYGSSLIFSHLLSTAQFGDLTALTAFIVV